MFLQVANLACSMSVNPEKVKMVRLAAKRLQNLCPQVRISFAFNEIVIKDQNFNGKECSKNCMYCTSTIQKYSLENLPQFLFCT